MTLQSGFINSNTGRKMREVSKDWCSIIDWFYNKPHAYQTCLPLSFFPHMTLKVPIDVNGAKRINEFVKHDKCQFIGRRLTLLLSQTKEPINSKIENDTMRSVCARVEHLTIKKNDEDPFNDQEIQDICEPFLRQMCNLTSITCDLNMDVELVLLLPNPGKLNVITTRHLDAFRDTSDDWERVFTGCRSNLKIFDCIVYTRGMKMAFSHLIFDNLLELRATDHYWDIDDPDDDEYDEDGSSYVFDLNTADAKQRFPVLKRIAIPFFGGNYGDRLGENQWVFPERIMHVTNNLDTIEEIELRASFMWQPITLDYYPLRQGITESRNTNVWRLVFRIGFFYESFEWGKRLALMWPSVRSLRIAQQEYVRVGNEWVTVGVRSKCTECF